LGESLDDGGETVRARPNFGFGLIADEIINMGELSTENLCGEGGGEVEDEDLEISSTEGHIQGTSRKFISPFPSPKSSC